jgi:hypothetical protein
MVESSESRLLSTATKATADLEASLHTHHLHLPVILTMINHHHLAETIVAMIETCKRRQNITTRELLRGAMLARLTMVPLATGL